MRSRRTPARPETAGPAPLVWLWLAFFGYSLAAGLLLQLVLLPHVFPSWHAGHGLLVGGDWITFHQVAADVAKRIREHGWSAVELRPDRYAPAGIAGAIYALTVPELWTVLPFNAALHATAGVLLLCLVRLFVPAWRRALASVLPFLLYPSALTWVPQIHKDGAFILGALSVLYGMSRLARDEPVRGGWTTTVRAIALILLGLTLAWVVRPDVMRLLQAAALLVTTILVGACMARATRHPTAWPRALAVSALVSLTTLAPSWLPDTSLGPERPVTPALRSAAPPAVAVTRSVERVAPEDDPNLWYPRRGVVAIAWYGSDWLPSFVETRAYRLALIREQFIVSYAESRSNIDTLVAFRRTSDLLRYLPRATQIVLWAPFPTQWRVPGSVPWTDALRRITALEMIGVYAATALLPLAVWRWRRRVELWIVLLFCLLVMDVYALAIPNLGALHRFRYGFLMVMVALGIAGSSPFAPDAGSPARGTRVSGGPGARPAPG